MAKKKLSTIENWNGVNDKLRELSEKKIELARAEGRQTLEINNIREKYNDITEGLTKEISEIEKDIERFCEQNKDEFLEDRTKRFSFGTISYRITRSFKIADTIAAIKGLKTLKYFDCLKTEVSIIKENLKKVDKSILTKCGITMKEVDKISIEPVLDTIPANDATAQEGGE